MTGQDAPAAITPIRITHRVAVRPEDAFSTFVDRLQAWWPPSATWSGDVLETVAIEPRLGGFCHERGPHGLRLDWGRVVAWEPPHRLAFSWQIAFDRTPEPNPARASQVELTFAPDGDGTRVTLTHDGFARHGADGQAYRDAMASDAGWPTILGRYRAAIARREEAPWEGLST